MQGEDRLFDIYKRTDKGTKLIPRVRFDDDVVRLSDGEALAALAHDGLGTAA